MLSLFASLNISGLAASCCLNIHSAFLGDTRSVIASRTRRFSHINFGLICPKSFNRIIFSLSTIQIDKLNRIIPGYLDRDYKTDISLSVDPRSGTCPLSDHTPAFHSHLISRTFYLLVLLLPIKPITEILRSCLYK